MLSLAPPNLCLFGDLFFVTESGNHRWGKKLHFKIPKSFKMVGATGFEPATTRTPSECATGLRYAPISSSQVSFESHLISSSRIRTPHRSEDLLQVGPHSMQNHFRGRAELFRRLLSTPTRQLFPRSCNREAFFIQHPFNFEYSLDVFTHVDPLAAPTLFGMQQWKF